MPSILETMSRLFRRKPTKAMKDVAGAIDQELSVALVNAEELSKQYAITTAEGDELAEWGSWFNVYRESGEGDDEYRGRILSTVSTPKNTIPAIKQAVATYLSNYYGVSVFPADVAIYEPYTNIIRYSDINSKYSSDDRYPDQFFYRSNVISIVIPYGATEGLKNLLQTIKPAGLRVSFDVQLVPERPDPTSPGSEPVDATYVNINEFYELEMFMKAVGTDGFVHPFMNGELLYSGKRYLWTALDIEFDLSPVEPSPITVKYWHEIEALLKAQSKTFKAKTEYEKELLMKALSLSPKRIGTQMILGQELRKVQAGEAKIQELQVLEMNLKLKVPGVTVKPVFRTIDLDMKVTIPAPTMVYESSIDMGLFYNDDEFNIKLSSAYTIQDIGDWPLAQPSWINGPVQIDITNN